MARPKKDIAQSNIVAMAAAGAKSKTIAAALGENERTIRRRLAESKGEVKATRAAKRAKQAPLPDADADIPPETSLEQIDYWLRLAEKEAKSAEVSGDAEMLVKMVRLATSLLDARRKAMPLPKPDPNENPDMIAAKEKARKEFHRLIDHSLITKVRLA